MKALHVGALWRPSEAEIQVIAEHWPPEIEFVASTSSSPPVPVPEARASVDVVVGLPFYLDAQLVREMPRLRLVHVLGHGIDSLLEPELADLLRRREIIVARTNSASIAVAEFALMAMITLARRVMPLHHELIAEGSWGEARKAQRMVGGLGGELAGKECLIVGYGGVGRALAPRAKALGLHVTVARRHPGHEPLVPSVDRFISMDHLDKYLGEADHVVVCVPLTARTRELFDRSRLAALGPGSHLVNVARGEVLDEVVALELLRAGRLGGLALDVWRSEEDPSAPLPGADWAGLNLLATPHISGLTREARLRSLETIGEQLRRFLADERLQNTADLAAGY